MKFAKILEVLCFLAWFLTVLLGDALLNAWAMSKLWHWFAVTQYGEGPQLGVWFGVSIIARLMLHVETDEKRARRQDDDEQSWVSILLKTLWSWGGTLFVLCAAWCIGSVFHWVS